MDESQLKGIASQLSCPQGEDGLEVGNKMNLLNSFITRHTIEVLSPQQNEVIAELGPGNGALSESMIDALGNNGRYYGIEPSDVMAKEAKQRLSNRSCAVDIICGNHMDARIPENSLDGLMAVNVLYFIDDLPELFNQIKGWMKLDSRVVFGIRSDKSLSQMPFTQHGFNIRSLDEIKDSMILNGFSGVTSTYYDEGTVTFEDLELPVDSIIIKGTI